MTTSHPNLLDALAADVGATHDLRNLMVRHHAGARAPDVVLFVAPGAETTASPRAEARGHRLTPSSAGRIEVRLDDDAVAVLGCRLEQEHASALGTRDLEAGQRWVVNYGNPNATKALHVGHLRQLAVGQALACMHETAGADVIRQTRIGDFGRNIGEALAGYRAFGAFVPIGAAGVKGDRYVGECYARYVRRLADDAERVVSGDGAALAREGDDRRDEAERLLAEWRSGGPASQEFEALRRWVLDGHDETMARLGITMRRTLLESDHLAHGSALQDLAMSRGLVVRAASGATQYETGEEGYPLLLLCRPDGFPTQHLRYIATWDAVRRDYGDARSIGVLGAEWAPMARFAKTLLARLRGPDDVHPHHVVIHGMVVAGDTLVKSSRGDDSVLLDVILDRLVADQRVQGLVREHDRLTGDAVAAMLLVGHFLSRPMMARATLTTEELFARETSLGWALARAAAHAFDPVFDGGPDPAAGDVAYRTLVVQSQVHRRLLRRCLERSEILPLARFHFHLGGWYLEQPASPRLARAMRAVLTAGLTTLGLGRPPAATGAQRSPATAANAA